MGLDKQKRGKGNQIYFIPIYTILYYSKLLKKNYDCRQRDRIDSMQKTWIQIMDAHHEYTLETFRRLSSECFRTLPIDKNVP